MISIRIGQLEELSDQTSHVDDGNTTVGDCTTPRILTAQLAGTEHTIVRPTAPTTVTKGDAVPSSSTLSQ